MGRGEWEKGNGKSGMGAGNGEWVEGRTISADALRRWESLCGGLAARATVSTTSGEGGRRAARRASTARLGQPKGEHRTVGATKYARRMSQYIVLGVFVGFTTLIAVQVVILRMEMTRRLKFSTAMLAAQTVFCGALAVVAPTGRTRLFALVLVAAGSAATVRTWQQRKKLLDEETRSVRR